MAGEWREARLGQLGEVNRGRSRHRPRDAAHLYGGAYPFIQTGDIKASGGRITSHCQTYNEAGLAQSRLWPEGTMVITIAANIAETAILTYPACFPDSVVGFIADKHQGDARFIEYLFRQLRRQIQHENVGTGSVQDNINLQTLARLTLKVPEPPEQRRIAHILGTLDDKIENNRKTAKTLEAMAQAIFQSWFVDFDPVRAKMAGESRESICKRLKITPEILDLFPDRLVDSELGEIPEGWGVGSLGDIARNVRRTISPSIIEKDTPYIALEHMQRQSVALHEWDMADSVESNKFYFRKGEILFGKLRPYFHKVGIAPIDGICSTDILVITPKSDEWLGFALGHFSSRNIVSYASSGSTGTRMPRTSWNQLAEYVVTIPTEQIATKFNEIILNNIENIIFIIHSNRSIKSIRDTLLPKLVSGEVRVSGEQCNIELVSK